VTVLDSHVDRIKPDSFGITTYLENLRRGQYQIPTFQREVVWDRNRVKGLWDSIYKFYPLGSILVWRTEVRLQNHREIGGHLLRDEPSRREFQYLLDGQQRTTALLTSIHGGSIKGQEGRDPSLFIDLTIKDIDEVDDESWRQRFLFWDEIDDRDGQLHRNVPRKQRYDAGMIVKLKDIAHRYSDLERQLVDAGCVDYDDSTREQLRRLKHVFDNYKLSFIELRGIEVAEVCQIFERINQAGQPLSMFDIVVAKTFRPMDDELPGFYLRGLFERFRHDLELAGSRFAAVDDMTILQTLAVLVHDSVPDSGVHNITDRYLNELRTEHLESVWEDGTEAIRKVYDFLDNYLHLPGPALVPYRYFYMSIASYFFRTATPDYDLLKRYFWYYSFHNNDLLSNTTQLLDHVSRFHEVHRGGDFGFDRFLIDRDHLRHAIYSNRGRLSRAILSLYANQDPRDWAHPDRSVLAQVFYVPTDHPNLHHIFPLDFCEKNLGEHARYADSLMNIAYLTQITNLQVSNQNPLEYLQTYLGPTFADVQRTHLLPDLIVEWARASEMPDDALDIFIEARLELVLTRLRGYLDGVQFETIDSRSVLGQDEVSDNSDE